MIVTGKFLDYKRYDKMKLGVSVFILLVVISGIFLTYMSRVPQTITGDESTYIAQAMSFAYDFDNVYDATDYSRFCSQVREAGPAGIFLNYVDGEFYYSKPYLYAFMAVPWVLLFGVNGINLFNLWCLFGIVFITYLYLRKYNSKKISALMSVLLYGASFATAYIFDVYIDLFNAFWIFLGCYLLYLYFEDTSQNNVKIDKRKSFILLSISAVILGIMTSQRSPYIFILAFAFLKFILERRFKEATVLFCVSATAFFMINTRYFVEIHTFSPYNGNRYYFLNNFPYSPDFSMENAHMVASGTSNILSKIFYGASDIKAVVMNLWWYCVGRQTGCFIYAPFVLLLFINISKTSIKKNWYLLVGVFFHILFFMLQGYNNYYGGGQSFGNRYFLQVMPLFVFLITTLDIKKTVIAGILASGIFRAFMWSSPAFKVTNVISFRGREIMQLLPLEFTQLESMYHLEPHNAIEFQDGGYIYIPSGTHAGIEGKRFWTNGTKYCEMAIGSKEVVESVAMSLTAGPFDTTVTINGNEYIQLKPGEKKKIDVAPKYKGTYYGNHYYELTVQSSTSFVPAETMGTNDHRILGIQCSEIMLK